MKKTTKIASFFLAVSLVALTGCKTLQDETQSKKYTTPEGVTLLTEAELKETLVGNTYAGESTRKPGNNYIEYIQPDGKIKGLWNKEKYNSEWAVHGSVWCYKSKNSSSCNTVSKSGNTIYWYQLDGTTEGGKSEVMAGNPNNL